MKIRLLLFSFIFYTSCIVSSQSSPPVNSAERVRSLPGLGTINELQLAGHLPLSGPDCVSHHCQNKTGNLFYWFVASPTHSAKTPIVLWLNGGPGAASLYGFFMENGPYVVQKNGHLSKRRYSWTKQADYLVIDQPAGVGFSYGNHSSYANEAEAMDQLYHALKLFFQRYPQFAAQPFYLAGESYAGKYLPQLAIRILDGNTHDQKIQLKGLLIGDGWVNPRLQQAANIDFAYTHGLIDKQAQTKVKELYQECIKEIDKTTPSSRRANQVCEKIQDFIKKTSGNINLANIATGTEPDDTAMIHYLNRPAVRKALHSDPRVKKYKTFSKIAADILEIGEQDSVANLYTRILTAGIPVLIYNGLEDGKDSNFMSTDLWLAALNWPGKKSFAQASTCVWHTDGQVAGYVKTAAGLTQVKIRGAGHLAPIDQPARLLDLFTHFIHQQPLC
ncbi:TPA: S10 family peptidase [Legionella feeleii]